MNSLVSLLLLLGSVAAQDKWVWNGKTAKAVRTPSGQVRYGLYDPEDDLYDGGPGYRPSLRPPPPDLPPLIRPPPTRDYRPRPEGRPDYDQRPPPQGRPDYDRRPLPPPPPHRGERPEQDPTRFEKCKCTHSFNCKSPGLLFGSCDAGKKYCCEKSPHGGGGRDFVPDDRDPEVLAGPGGPVDHLQKPLGGGGGTYGGDRPPRPGNYGIRPDGSLGIGGGGQRPGPRY